MKTVHQIARGLGWFSIALGLGEVFGGRQLDKTLGTANRRNVFRLFGAREIITGLGVLSGTRPKASWLWARVAGDALDLTALGESLRLKTADRKNLLVAIAAVAGVTALDVFCASALDREA